MNQKQSVSNLVFQFAKVLKQIEEDQKPEHLKGVIESFIAILNLYLIANEQNKTKTA